MKVVIIDCLMVLNNGKEKREDMELRVNEN